LATAEAKKNGEKSQELLRRALEERMPLVAEELLAEDASRLDELSMDGEMARKAHAAGAWSVLAALLDRGDPMPAQPRLLLDYALRAGHAGLARSCLSHLEDARDMEAAVRTCLDHGRTEIVREALEALWRVRSSLGSEGPPLLSLECGPADQPAECPVCFDALYTNPGVFVGEHGLRVCGHFTCLDCAEHVQDEAGDRFRVWRARREPRLPRPPGPVCPLCRASFASAVRLTDPTVDPRGFFKLACTQEDGQDSKSELVLQARPALAALGALLPVSPVTFAQKFDNELWTAWCEDPAEGLREANFLRPGGMLAWLSSHILEIKVEGQLGQPPRLQDSPEKWFDYFDYNNLGLLTKSEVLRGTAKAYDVAQLSAPGTPSRRARAAGVLKLREIVDAVWDDDRWHEGVVLEDFVGGNGLAERLLAALPGGGDAMTRMNSRKSTNGSMKMSVSEALAAARASDFKMVEADEERAKVRKEKQLQPIQVQGHGAPALPVPGQQRAPGHHGAQLLLASLLEAAREENRGPATSLMRIQCPFCGAINQARASQRHRIICGACRSVFAVPAPAQGGREV